MTKGAKMTDFAAPFEFDIQLFADEGGTETTAPATEPTDTAGSEFMSDEPAPTEQRRVEIDINKLDDEPEEPEPEPEEPAPEPDDDKLPGNDEKGNARWAEMRRKAEEADHLRQEIARRDQEMLKRFGEQGIKTFDDLVAGWDRAMDQQRQAQAQQVQQQTATFEQGLNRMVQQMQAEGYDDISISARVDAAVANFKVQQMELRLQQQEQQRALEQKQKAAQQQQLQQQANVEQGTKLLLEDYDNLKKEYGELLPEAQGATPAERFQSLITQLDQETLGKLQRGYTLRDAYESSNRQAIMQKAAAAAKQKTVNELNSKKHLKTEGDGATEAAASTALAPETLEMYMDSGMTEKQARAFHKKLYG